MPAYYPPSGFKIPWLIIPDQEEFRKIYSKTAWDDFVKRHVQALRDQARSDPQFKRKLLAHEELARSMQFLGADEAADELGMPLDMRELHKMMSIGTGNLQSSHFCILPYSSPPLAKASKVSLYGFKYTHDFLKLIDEERRAGRVGEETNTTTIPYIGIDPKVMEWIIKYGKDIPPPAKIVKNPQSGRTNAETLLWGLRRIAMLGDHDWHHQATIFQKFPDGSVPFTKDFGASPSLYNMAKESGLITRSDRILSDVYSEDSALNTNLRVFETIFKKRPKVKEAILRQTYEFFERLGTLREQALAQGDNPKNTDNCCSYLSYVLLLHLFRLPITEKDLTSPIPSVGNRSVRDVVENLHLEEVENYSFGGLIRLVASNHNGPHMKRLEHEVRGWSPDSADPAIIATSQFQLALEKSPLRWATEYPARRSDYEDSPEATRAGIIHERMRGRRQERQEREAQEKREGKVKPRER